MEFGSVTLKINNQPTRSHSHRVVVGDSRGSYADFGTELVSDPYQVTKLATIFRNQSFSNNLVWNWKE